MYAHVDDFLVGGTDDNYTQQLASTSEPVKNPSSVLGYEVERDSRERKLIKVTNQAKIAEHCGSSRTIFAGYQT